MGLRQAISTTDGKRRYVSRLFSTIAPRYDLITVLLSYGRDRAWKRRLISLATVTPADVVLDLACGTGDLLFAAARQARVAIGVDLTLSMLRLAASKSAGKATALVAGDMLALPVRGARITLVTVGYGLRNVVDLDGALDEIDRVLAPGGRLLSLDFNRPANPVIRGLYLSYLTVVGSVVGLVLHGDADTYRYIPESIRGYPGAAGVADLLATHGFTNVRVEPLLGGLMTIHVAHKPR